MLFQATENAALEQTFHQEDPGEASLIIKVPQSTTPKPVVAERSLWALAYDDLQKSNPELIKKFNFCLGIKTPDTDDGNFVHSRIDKIVQKALEELRKVDSSKEKLNGTSAAIRKCFERAVKFIIASNDFVSSAVSANPYAALAWTGVSLLLPVSWSEISFHITANRIALS